MSSTQGEQNVYVAIKFIESRNLPSGKKKDKKRRFYAVLSIEGRSDAKFELHGLGAQDEKVVDFPMIFFAKLSTAIQIKLYESTSDKNQILLAYTQVPLRSLDGEVGLKHTADSGLQTDVVLGFTFNVSCTLSEEQADSEIRALESRLKSHPKLCRAFEHLRLFLTIGAAIAEINTFVKVAFKVVTAIASVIEKYLVGKSYIISLLEDIGAVCGHVRDLDVKKHGDLRLNQHAAFQALFPVIYNCLHFICSLGRCDLFGMTLTDTVKTRVEENANLLKRALDGLKSAHQQDTQAAVFETLYAVGGLTVQMKSMDHKLNNIFDDMHQKDKILAELHLASNTPKPASCLDGTRTAVLDIIEKWGRDQTAERLLLLRGAAGKGKSTILSTVAQTLEDSHAAVVPFFAFKNQSLPSLIPTWVKHLARHNEGYFKYLHGLNPEDRSTKNTDHQYKILLKQGLSHAYGAKPIVFALDALDECPKEDLNELVSILNNLISLASSLTSSIRFLFTSRPISEALKLAQGLGSSALSYDINEEPGTVNDILKFIQDRLKLTSLQGMVSEVANVSETSFECAALLCRELTTNHSGRVTKTVFKKILSQLHQLPGMKLYGSYYAILCMHITDKDDLEFFRQLMAWVLLVRSPQPQQVFRAIASVLRPGQETDVDVILSWLSSFLHGAAPEDNAAITPHHTSFKEFLLDEQASKEFFINITSHDKHNELALACFRIMNAEPDGLKFNICQLPRSDALNKDMPGLKRVSEYISPGLQYACHSMAYHLQQTVHPSKPQSKQIYTMEIAVGIAVISVAVLAYNVSHSLLWALLVAITICLPLHAFRTMIDQFAWEICLNNVCYFATHYITMWYDKDYFKSSQGFKKEIELQLRHFLEENFLYWLEAHSCMSTWQNGPGAILRELHKWALFMDFKEFEPVILDFIRFEKISREGYMSSAPQVYYSGLMLAPLSSKAFKFYGHKYCIPAMVTSGQGHRWPRDGYVMKGTSTVKAVAFSADGTKIVSGLEDGTIYIWDATVGERIGKPLEGHESNLNSIAFSPDGTKVVSGSNDRTIRVWDVEAAKQIGDPLEGHDGWVQSVAFSPDGSKIVSGSDDRTIRVWDVETAKQIGDPLEGHDGWVWSVAFSPDGTKVVSGSNDRTIRVWDVEAAKQIGDPLEGHDGWVQSVAFSPDGTKVVSGSDDRTIRVWDVEAAKQIGDPLEGHDDWVQSVAFSPDGTKIVSGSSDKTIRVWDVEASKQIGDPLEGHDNCVWSVAFSPDGTKVVSGSDDRTIRVWDVEAAKQIGDPLEGHDGLVLSVAFSPDGTKIVSGSDDKTIRVWDVEAAKQIGDPLEGHEGCINSVAFSPDGTKIVSGSSDKTIRVWDVEAAKQIGDPLEGHDGWVRSVAFSPDGTKVVSGSDDRTIRIWDVETAKQIDDPLEGHDDWVRSVAFSPDGTKVVSGSDDRTIRVWDVEAAKQIGDPLEGHDDWVQSVAFSPDGTKIVSGSSDKTIRVWDVEASKQIGDPLEGHDDWVQSVAFSPDGTKIVSGSDDRTIRVWDVEAAKQIGDPLEGHDGLVQSVAFSPDGTKIVSGSYDRTIQVWNDHISLGASQLIRHNDWIKWRTNGDMIRLLWIPYPYRSYVFTAHPCVTVLSKRHIITMNHQSIVCGSQWAKIKKQD
ncbi:hypothetical protein PTI98_011032 [Pleurotus ostreatus]|nr:hypothetical protein PTI98_011032 [Pleurotus ostreatus]